MCVFVPTQAHIFLCRKYCCKLCVKSLQKRKPCIFYFPYLRYSSVKTPPLKPYMFSFLKPYKDPGKLICGNDRLSFLCNIVEMLIKAEPQKASRNIINVMISMSLQCKHRVIARLPCFAVQIYRSVLRDFFHTLPDLTNGNIYHCFYLSHAIGLLVPDVPNKGSFLHKAAHLVHPYLPERFLQQITGHRSCVISSILPSANF